MEPPLADNSISDAVFRFLIGCAKRIWPETSRIFLAQGNPYRLLIMSPRLAIPTTLTNTGVIPGRCSISGVNAAVQYFKHQDLPEGSVLIGVDDESGITEGGQGNVEGSVVAWMLAVPRKRRRETRAATIRISRKGQEVSCRLAYLAWEPDMSSVLFKYRAERICYLPTGHQDICLLKNIILSAIIREEGVFIGTYDRRTKSYRESLVLRQKDLSSETKFSVRFSSNGSHLVVWSPSIQYVYFSCQQKTFPIRYVIDLHTGDVKRLSMPKECEYSSPTWIDDKTWIEVISDSREDEYAILIVRHPFLKIDSVVRDVYNKYEIPKALAFNSKTHRILLQSSRIDDSFPTSFLTIVWPEKNQKQQIFTLFVPEYLNNVHLHVRVGGEEFLWQSIESSLVTIEGSVQTKNFNKMSLWRSRMDQGSFRQIMDVLIPFPGVNLDEKVNCGFDFDGKPIVVYEDSLWRTL